MADGMGLADMASLLSTIHGIYPQARVTSGYRGPNNPLTLRNPSSMHAMGSPSDPRAVDVAPIPGVNFNDYVSSVKKAGVPIAQAFDEASHPFPWTTGPNWHLATGQQQPAPQARPPAAPPNPYYNPQPGGQQMPPQMPPQGNPYQQGQPPQMAPMSPSLAGLAQPMQTPQQGGNVGPNLAAFAQSQVPPGSIPAKSHSKLNIGNIAGILGDALSAYGGRQPTFGPMLNQEHMMEQQQGFEREKFNQELQMRMYAMTHPQDMMDGIAFANAPKDVQQAMVYRENALHPTVAGVQQPNGSVINTVIPRQLPPQVGEIQDGHRFLGGDPANQQSWEAVQ